jgi:hypothetical protein
MARTVYTLPAELEALLGMATYPGMIADESRVLRQFIRRHFRDYDELRFDVRLGIGSDPGDEFEEATRRAMQHVTRKRADALGWKGPNVATLIEAKWDFSNDGVWQLLSYRDDYARAFPDHFVLLVGVAAAASVTARELASRMGVRLFVYALPPNTVDVGESASEAGGDGV